MIFVENSNYYDGYRISVDNPFTVIAVITFFRVIFGLFNFVAAIRTEARILFKTQHNTNLQ